MCQRSQAGGGALGNGSNLSMYSGDRSYAMTRWLSFVEEVSEKRFVQDYLIRRRVSFLGIVIFNVGHIISSFLGIESFETVGVVLQSIMICSLLFALSVLFLSGKYIERNMLFQTLIRLSSLFYYVTCYIDITNNESNRYLQHLSSSNLLQQSYFGSLGMCVHMTLSNLLTLPRWTQHVIVNLLSFSLTMIIVVQFSPLESPQVLLMHTLYFFGLQLGMFVFVGFLEKFMREFWVLFDSFKKSTRQLERILDELPQPLFILGTNQEILLQNVAGQKFLASIQLNQKDVQQNAQPNIMQKLRPQDAKIVSSLIKQAIQTTKTCSAVLEKLPKSSTEPTSPLVYSFVASTVIIYIFTKFHFLITNLSPEIFSIK